MDSLIPRLVALPELDHELVIKAMAASIDHTFVIWPRAQEKAQYPTQDETAKSFLQAFENNGQFPGGLAFAKALSQAKLDYSRESLARIDKLLEQIRTKVKPEVNAFIEKQENQNFLYLLCFYLGEMVSRHGQKNLHWYAWDEMLQLTQETDATLPRCFGSSMTCIFESGGYFLPLSCLMEGLFANPPDRSVVAALQKFIAPATELSLPFVRVDAKRAGELPLYAREAVQLCGLLASNGLALVQDGTQAMPILASFVKSGQKTMTVLADESICSCFPWV